MAGRPKKKDAQRYASGRLQPGVDRGTPELMAARRALVGDGVDRKGNPLATSQHASYALGIAYLRGMIMYGDLKAGNRLAALRYLVHGARDRVPSHLADLVAGWQPAAPEHDGKFDKLTETELRGALAALDARGSLVYRVTVDIAVYGGEQYRFLTSRQPQGPKAAASALRMIAALQDGTDTLATFFRIARDQEERDAPEPAAA